MKKSINIYLVANEENLVNDENELGTFINGLNEKYKDYNIYFNLVADDDFDELDENEIKNSELFYIIFCDNINDDTINKFNLAYNNFKEKLTPKISTYVKNYSENKSQSIKDFMQKLDQELGHYYSSYDNIDTLKLDLILKLDTLGLEMGNIETKEGKLYLGDQELMPIDNVNVVSNNKSLKELKKKKEQIDNETLSLYEKFKQTNDDSDFKKYTESKEECKKINDEIFAIQKDIINAENSFIKASAKGKLSQRQIHAQKCLEKGDLKTALEMLNDDEMQEDANRKIEIKKMQNQEIDDELRISVNEFVQKAEILKLDVNNPDRFEQIEKAYESAINIEREADLYRSSLIKYLEYLYSRKKYKKAVLYGQEFVDYINSKKIESNDLMRVYSFLGLSYTELEENELAKNCHNKCLEILTKMEKENPNLKFGLDSHGYKFEIATINSNLAYLYSKMKQYDLAEEHYKKAIEIREEIDKNSKSIDNSSELSRAYQDLAKMYIDKEIPKRFFYITTYIYDKDKINVNVIELAEDYYKKSIKIREELVQNDPENYIASLIFLYTDLIEILVGMRKIELVEEYCNKAIEAEKIFRNYNTTYKGILDGAYRALEIIYEGKKDKNLAEEYKNKQYKKEGISKFSRDLSKFDDDLKRYREYRWYDYAEKEFDEKIKTFELLAEDETPQHIRGLVSLYCTIAAIYSDENKYNFSVEYYEKSIKLIEKLILENSNEYQLMISYIYYNLANVYKKIKEYDLAEKYYKSSIEIKEKCFEKNNGDIYKNFLAIAYYNLADLYNDIKKNELSENYYKKAIILEEKVNVKKEIGFHGAFEGNLIVLYHSLADLYKKCKKNKLAKKYYKKAIKYSKRELNYKIKSIINKDRFRCKLIIKYSFYKNLSVLYKCIENNRLSTKFQKKSEKIVNKLNKNNDSDNPFYLDFDNLEEIYHNFIESIIYSRHYGILTDDYILEKEIIDTLKKCG